MKVHTNTQQKKILKSSKKSAYSAPASQKNSVNIPKKLTARKYVQPQLEHSLITFLGLIFWKIPSLVSFERKKHKKVLISLRYRRGFSLMETGTYLSFCFFPINLNSKIERSIVSWARNVIFGGPRAIKNTP